MQFCDPIFFLIRLSHHRRRSHQYWHWHYCKRLPIFSLPCVHIDSTLFQSLYGLNRIIFYELIPFYDRQQQNDDVM